MARGSRHPGARRRLLVAANLLLLIAVAPAIGRSAPNQDRRDVGRAKPKPADDDDAAEVVGKVAVGCCAGFIGALADSAANDASDANEARPAPRINSGGESLGPEPVRRVEFDKRAAKQALSQAVKDTKGCEAAGEQPGKYRVSVVFGTTGQVRTALFEPPLWHGLERCALASFFAIEVPPFEGDDVIVHKSFTLY